MLPLVADVPPAEDSLLMVATNPSCPPPSVAPILNVYVVFFLTIYGSALEPEPLEAAGLNGVVLSKATAVGTAGGVQEETA